MPHPAPLFLETNHFLEELDLIHDEDLRMIRMIIILRFFDFTDCL